MKSPTEVSAPGPRPELKGDPCPDWTFSGKSYFTRLLGPEHEGIMRRALRETPMTGRISIAFGREPDFFAPSANPERCHAFVVAVKPKNGPPPEQIRTGDIPPDHIAAVCAHSTLPVYFKGQKAALSYLHLLRVLPAFRRRIAVLRDGYAAMRAFKDLVNPAGPCISSIVADNAPARRILTAGLDAIPQHLPLGTLRTYALSTRAGRRRNVLKAARPEDMPDLAAFYARSFEKWHFAPCLDEAWFSGLGSPAMPDLRLGDFFIRRGHDGQITGSLALWDQRASRQNIIAGYEPLLRYARPFVNLAALCCGRPTLPRPGSVLSQAFLAFPLFDTRTPHEYRQCISEALFLAALRGVKIALIGATPYLGHERSFHEEELRHLKGIPYDSLIYTVHWQDRSQPHVDREIPVWTEPALL